MKNVLMLNKLGFGLEGYEFEFDMSESLSLVEQAKIDVSLMPYFKLSSEYIESKYGVEIEDEPMGVMEEEVSGSEAESGMAEGESESSIENKLKNLYR